MNLRLGPLWIHRLEQWDLDILQRAQLTTSEAFWLNALLTRLSTPPAPPAHPE